MKRIAHMGGMVALVLLSWAGGAHAQEQSGSIIGVVKDTSGAVLPGVTVEARSQSLVGVSTTTSGGDGAYRFPALPPGTYELTATLAGFTDKKVGEVVLALGQVLKIELAMAVGGLSETVQIHAESPLIDVKQNAAAATISKEAIDRIPKGRDWTSVIQTAPGANSETRAGGFQIDGSSGSENRFIVDGMDRTNLRTGTSSTATDATTAPPTVLVDFLDQVQVKSSGYTAEYGGSTGGVISAITKSGSNQVHGSLGTYYRGDDLQSAPRAAWRINPFNDCATCAGTPEFVATPDTSFDNWNPIGDLGGPILHDRAWFYFGTSYNRTDNERTTTFRNSPAPYVTKDMTTWSDSKDDNWNATTQLSRDVRLRVSGANTRSANRFLPTATQLQPDGSVFADGTPTNGFNTATWDADPEAFKDRWVRTGANGRSDTYVGNLDWVVAREVLHQRAGRLLRL